MPLDTAAKPAASFKSSACPHDCPATCALEVEVLPDNRVGRFRGASDNAYTAGVLCAKVGRYADRVHHPDRLMQPLRRTGPKGSGKFTPISWDDALDEISARFKTIAETHGAEAIWPYYYAGTMGQVQRDGIHRLRHALGYSDQKRTICTALARSGWVAGTGFERGTHPQEMLQSEVIVIWGGNPVTTHVHIAGFMSKARKQNGAKIVVIDPYRSPTADLADMHLPLLPGTDGALACAVMHIAFRDGRADRAYMAAQTKDYAALEAHVATKTPEWAAAITGLTAQQIEDFAALYTGTQKAYLMIGYGFSRVRNGTLNVHAVTCLPAVTGAWQVPGGGAFWSYGATLYKLNKRLIDGTPMRRPDVRVMDMSRIGAALTGHLTGDQSELQDGPPVMALLIQNTNPMVVAPNSALVAQGFAREDLFTVVHEQFMTDTALMADIVLPATMFVEHDDLYTAGGHGHLQVGMRLIDPPGECRSNHDVINALGQRLGVGDKPGFDLTAREMIERTLTASGYPDLATFEAQRWVDCTPSSAEGRFESGFATPDKKFHFAPDWSSVGIDDPSLPRLPDHWDIIAPRDAEHPFKLIAPPARQFLNSSFSDVGASRVREGTPKLLIHPDTAAAQGISDGDLVTVGNAQGSITLTATVRDGMNPALLVAEGLWRNGDFPEKLGINTLVSDFSPAPAGGAVFHDTAVWMRPRAHV